HQARAPAASQARAAPGRGSGDRIRRDLHGGGVPWARYLGLFHHRSHHRLLLPRLRRNTQPVVLIRHGILPRPASEATALAVTALSTKAGAFRTPNQSYCIAAGSMPLPGRTRPPRNPASASAENSAAADRRSPSSTLGRHPGTP